MFRIPYYMPFPLWKHVSLYTMLDGYYAGEGWRLERYGYKSFRTEEDATAWIERWQRGWARPNLNQLELLD